MTRVRTQPPVTFKDAFLSDHQSLVRGLSRILEALREGEDDRAVIEADALDRTVGAHMEFEETVFYPELAKTMEAEEMQGLYSEHRVGKQVLLSLIQGSPATPLFTAERDQLIGEIDAILDHAVACGGLLHHLESLEPEQNERLLASLLEIRERKSRWTAGDAGGKAVSNA